jgi:putative ABC transport system permease protein
VVALNAVLSASADTIPELELIVSLAPATIAATVLLGVVVVGAAPVFTFRKLRRMDVPSTLRVME